MGDTDARVGTELAAGLRDRHVTMISIAGVIGWGFPYLTWAVVVVSVVVTRRRPSAYRSHSRRDG